jgi:uncharacterized protein (DUF1810 family)
MWITEGWHGVTFQDVGYVRKKKHGVEFVFPQLRTVPPSLTSVPIIKHFSLANMLDENAPNGTSGARH